MTREQLIAIYRQALDTAIAKGRPEAAGAIAYRLASLEGGKASPATAIDGEMIDLMHADLGRLVDAGGGI
jgi:hypothetical protein